MRQSDNIRYYAEDPVETPAMKKRRLSEEIGIESGPAPETQEQAYTRQLQEAKDAAAKQLADSQAANQLAVDDIEGKAAASRAAAEQSRQSAQTLRDNTQTDLTSSGDPLVISGGSAQQAEGDSQDVKKKLKGSGISAQVGINV